MNFRDIGDDEIRVVRFEMPDEPQRSKHSRKWLYIILIIGTLAAIIAVVCVTHSKKEEKSTTEQFETCYIDADAHTEKMTKHEKIIQEKYLSGKEEQFGSMDANVTNGYTEFADTAINDVPMRLFIPHNAEMSLHLGAIDKSDSTIVYAAQAADVRADNGKIAGAFVIDGEPIAKGLSKRGFCAVIDGKVTVGVANNSPLFEEAVKNNGSFFRQYALVDNGRPVENEPKGKAIRRAICDMEGKVFMVESSVRESFHDFANALADLGVDNAVYLVGSQAYGWAVGKNGDRYEFGDENRYSDHKELLKNTNYIIWRRK